jgi:hypothetical protein
VNRRLPGEPTAIALCLAFGVVISTLPHWLWWPELGEPTWIADQDELCYLAIGADSYHHHPLRLGDPAVRGSRINPYRPLPMVPGTAVAKALGAGPMAVGLIWRAMAGAALALGFYAVARGFLGNSWLAAAVSVFLMADGGLLEIRPVVRHLQAVADLLSHGRESWFLSWKPQLLPQWRMLTPALNFPFLLLHIWLVARARANPSRGRLIASGLGYGLLFHVYFYYWSAATAALALAWVLDAGHRRVYAWTGVIGVLIGLPSLVGDYLTKRSTSPDWLIRTDKFLPIPHLAELTLPKIAPLALLATLPLAWKYRRDLLHLWCLGLAGLLLVNHQVVTGLQIENFHFAAYVSHPCLTLLVVLGVALLIRQATRLRPAWPWLAAGLALYAALGLGLRGVEGRASPDPRYLLATYRRYVDQRSRPDASPMERGAVVAGDVDLGEFADRKTLESIASGEADPAGAEAGDFAGKVGFQDFAQILEDQLPLYDYIVRISPAVTTPELDERLALSVYLLGRDRSGFEKALDPWLRLNWGPWRRDPALRAARAADLMEAYDRVAADPARFLDRYGVRYLALPAGRRPPGDPSQGWRPFQAGPTWDLWVRETARSDTIVRGPSPIPAPSPGR